MDMHNFPNGVFYEFDGLAVLLKLSYRINVVCIGR